MAETSNCLELLLEIGGSRREVSVPNNNILQTIEEVLKKYNPKATINFNVDHPNTDADKYSLQRWSLKWNDYIDVRQECEIKHGDKIKLTSHYKPPVGTSSCINRALSICSKVGKPTQQHAEQLSKLFPASSSNPSTSSAFNPTAQSMNFDQKLKKKGSIRIKPFKLYVVVGDKVFTSVPKGGIRRKLNQNNRIAKIEFRRTMSSEKVKNLITEAFPHLNLTNPVFMKAQNNDMVRMEFDGFPNGYEVQSCASKESLYIVETASKPSVSSMDLSTMDLSTKDSDDDFLDEPALIKRVDGIVAKQPIASSKEVCKNDNSLEESTSEILKRADEILAKLKTPTDTDVITLSDSSDTELEFLEVKMESSKVKELEKWPVVIEKAGKKRGDFINNGSFFVGEKLQVNRPTIYKDVMNLYSNNSNLINQFPIEIEFMNEGGIDAGGLCRDFFSAFWEQAYEKKFDGSALLVPLAHADISSDMNDFEILAKILSHGFLVCGFIPTRIAFPVLCYALLGASVNIPQNLIVQSFCDFLTTVDQECISKALVEKNFQEELQTDVLNVVSRYGCRDIPTPNNLCKILMSVANYEFRNKPFVALTTMNAGIPDSHKVYWESTSVHDLYSLWSSLSASPQKVLEKIQEPMFKNPSEERIFNYLIQYVGGMKIEEAQKFLRFVTGSTVLREEDISISFNALTGIARRPIAHTCGHVLELSSTYSTYVEFVKEFSAVLSSKYCWPIDSA